MQKKNSSLYYFVDKFDKSQISNINKNINFIYRNYKKNINISTLILFKKYCKKNNLNLFISNNIKLALKYKLNGVYIPAFNKQINYVKYSLPKNFKIIGSAHNNCEISVKEKQGCKIIFISPIFLINKKKKFLDIIKFNLLTISRKNNYVALGGINHQNIKKLSLLKILGFAGISFFEKKTAP